MRLRKTLTQKQRDEVLAILSVGCSRAAATRSVRCSTALLRNDMLNDAEFAQQVAKAESGMELFYLSRIRNAMQKEQHWRAAAWMLERRLPQRYGIKNADTMTAEQVQKFMTTCIQVLADELTDEKLRKKVLEQLAKKMEGLDE
jgi:hypothetical protein